MIFILYARTKLEGMDGIKYTPVRTNGGTVYVRAEVVNLPPKSQEDIRESRSDVERALDHAKLDPNVETVLNTIEVTDS